MDGSVKLRWGVPVRVKADRGAGQSGGRRGFERGRQERGSVKSGRKQASSENGWLTVLRSALGDLETKAGQVW